MKSSSTYLHRDVRERLLKSAELQRQVAAECVDAILAAADLIATSFQ